METCFRKGANLGSTLRVGNERTDFFSVSYQGRLTFSAADTSQVLFFPPTLIHAAQRMDLKEGGGWEGETHSL